MELNTPIIQVPTLQDVLQAVLLEVEQTIWDMEVDQLPDGELPAMTDPYQSVESTPSEVALERVPRLREILAAAHQECNQSGDATGRIRDIFQNHIVQVLNHWTFAERGELEALARERMSAEDNQ